MFVAHISDPHVGAGRSLAFNVSDGALLLEKTVSHIAALPQLPDCLVLSGDISVNGQSGGYATAAEAEAQTEEPGQPGRSSRATSPRIR